MHARSLSSAGSLAYVASIQVHTSASFWAFGTCLIQVLTPISKDEMSQLGKIISRCEMIKLIPHVIQGVPLFDPMQKQSTKLPSAWAIVLKPNPAEGI